MIRKAREADLIMISKLEKKLFIEPWDYEQFLFELVANPIANLMVYEKNRQVIGYFDYWFSGESIELATIGVASKYQNQGIGEKILKYIEKEAYANYIHYLTLEVRISNQAAIALYEKFGFKLERIKKKYYPDGEDAYYMIKEL